MNNPEIKHPMNRLLPIMALGFGIILIVVFWVNGVRTLTAYSGLILALSSLIYGFSKVRNN